MPDNALWNTASTITQNWDGNTWTPTTTGSFSSTPSATECKFKCKTNYTWNQETSTCKADSKVSNCTGLPANAEWNTASTISQTWNGSSWQPSTTGVFSAMASTKNCYFKCKTNYTWNTSTSACVADTQPANCTGLPSNAQWDTVSEITQTWNGENWQPSTEGSYNETSSTTECHYKCKSGYFWNGSVCKMIRKLGEICTGQTKCYNNSSSITCPTSTSADFYGQDAQYRSKCIAQSFTVQTLSSQKVILDNNTGLMWQQTMPTSTYTWEDAGSYCSDLTYAGYSDWRLPTPQELLTIVANNIYDPAINTSYFPDTPSQAFWSSAPSLNDTSGNSAWSVVFKEGKTDGHYNHIDLNIRCVRGTILPTSSFNSSTVNGDVIVTDTKTGLIWQKTYAKYKTWKEALKYCESLTYAGYSDWRLPNKNELASLINYAKSPASNFPDFVKYTWFWSSSTYTGNTKQAWKLSHAGHIFISDKTSGDDSNTDGTSVRCVR